ncbi:hypothetical protein [Acidocella sp.]|uniref:hypothetical protein n=1 Tax=Acidocella sp. TaxID=50710 RepID=UPI002637A301|nr:hypothetical protein [Acidocella sp.]
MDKENRRLWSEFSALGLEEVRRQIAGGYWREAKTKQANAWINHYISSRSEESADAVIEEARAANELARSANELASAANAVARDANATAREAADAAKNNNKIAIAALAAAIISIMISILGIFFRHGGH